MTEAAPDEAEMQDPLAGLEGELARLRADLGPDGFEKLAQATAGLLSWMTDVRCAEPHWDVVNLIGRRAVSAAWVIDPRIPGEDGPSLAELGRRLGVSRANMSNQSAKFTREFGVRNRSQAHGWNRRAY